MHTVLQLGCPQKISQSQGILRRHLIYHSTPGSRTFASRAEKKSHLQSNIRAQAEPDAQCVTGLLTYVHTFGALVTNVHEPLLLANIVIEYDR